MRDYFRAFPDTSQFPLEALRDEGLDGSVRWLGAFAADDVTLLGGGGRTAGNTLLLESREHAGALAVALANGAPNDITGVSAEWSQAVAAYNALWPGTAPLESHHEWIFAVPARELRPPAQLTSGEWECRVPREDELPLLIEWRAEFIRDTLRIPGDAAGHRWLAERDIAKMQKQRDHFVLIANGAPVAYAKLSNVLDDVVEIGGVFTPEENRGRGYARGVVAGASLASAARGITRITLFTEPQNKSAHRSYEAIGFTRVAEYCGDYFHVRQAVMAVDAARHRAASKPNRI